MPSADPPPAATRVARRYLRAERAASAVAAVLAGGVGAAALLVLPFVPALAVLAGLLLALRLPVVRTEGRTVLRTDADPETVRRAFVGPTPPVLALQWGIADAVEQTGDDARYEVSYLFGLRSTTVAVAARPAGDAVTLDVAAGGRPWATYEVSARRAGDRTEAVVEWRSERRFGLRRLPQSLVARRYRAAALAAQGYETVRREGRLRLRSGG